MWHDLRMLNATTSALIAVLVLSLLGSGLWWVAHRPMFTLKVIRVEGMDGGQLRHVNPSTVRSAALPRIRGNFFTANLDNVRQAFEAVPWVRKASVRREWPNKLIVSVEEHQPLGTWGDDGRLLSVKGDVFTANLAEAEEDADLAAFSGPEGSQKEVLARYYQLAEWLKPASLAPRGLQLSDRYGWSMRLDNGLRVELGREQQPALLRGRVERLVNIYPQLTSLLQDRIESVDMRYPNGLALKAQGLALDSKKVKR
ncbi:MAG TPA: cell division protein FtsQ/DivIB [Noviherbaspirillum sp.]|jgi:cell division protein FtsQ|uniref:cell division protein FtsQ/DivIB n=1 Tax=Noviherbaspirillum sp. TaxID=1926288 RepID=UPI002F925A64